MKNLVLFLTVILFNFLTLQAQTPASNKIVVKTDSPIIIEESDAGHYFPTSEKEYQSLMKRLAQESPAFFTQHFAPIKHKPGNLSAQALYGINLSLGEKNISWIIEGNETQGYVFYADWNSDGDLRDDKPIKLKKADGKYQFEFSKILTETVDNKKQSYPFHIKVKAGELEPTGETKKKLAVFFYNQTIRKGVLKVNNRRIAVGLVGASGIYNADYNPLYFDLNGNNNFEVKDRYSTEIYKVSEKFINIEDKTYEFSVDRYGDSLTLTALIEELPPRAELAAGYKAPDFSFSDINGKNHLLSDFRGKIVLLDFWGTWCAPCVAEAPELAEVYNKFKDKGFEIVSFAKEEKVETIQNFIKKREMNWTHSQLQEGISKLYRIDGFPTYFLIDKDGKIISNDLRAGDEMYKKVEELLAESSMKVNQQ